MNKPSLVAGKVWHFVRIFLWLAFCPSHSLVWILSGPSQHVLAFCPLAFCPTSGEKSEIFCVQNNMAFKFLKKIMMMIHGILLNCESERLFLLC